VIAVSQATAADLAFHFPAYAARVRVVYEGVDPSFTPGSREEVAAIRRELGAPEGYILYIGTLEPRKNVGVGAPWRSTAPPWARPPTSRDGLAFDPGAAPRGRAATESLDVADDLWEPVEQEG
jgi:hypothetical protein